MKIVVLAISLFVVSFALERKCHERLYPLDKTLRYKYETHVKTKIPTYSEDAVTIQMETELLLTQISKDTFVIELQEPKLQNLYHTEEPLNKPIDPKVQEQFSVDLKKPIEFTLKNGKIVSELAQPTDKKFSMDLKRAVIRLFQSYCSSEKQEKTPSGYCKIHSFSTEDEEILSISDCDNNRRPETQLAQNRRSSISQSANVEIKYFKLESKNSILKHATMKGSVDYLRGKSEREYKTTTLLEQTLDFVRAEKKRPQTKLAMRPVEDIESEQMISKANQKYFISKVIAETSRFTQKEPEKITFEEVEKLKELTRKLSAESIVEVLRKLKENQRLIFQGVLRAENERVPFALKDIIKNQLLPESKIVHLIRTLSWGGPNSEDVIRTLLDSSDLKENTKRIREQIHLTVGALTRVLCRNDPKALRCTEHTRSMVINHLLEDLEKSSPNTRDFQNILKTIGNSGLSNPVLKKKFEEILLRQEHEHEHFLKDRIEVVKSMRKWSNEKEFVTRVLERVFRDRKEDAELRIESFHTLMQVHPSDILLQKLSMILSEETNMQVGSYVYSYLKKLSDLPDCRDTVLEEQQKMARSLLTRVGKFDMGPYYSRNMELSLKKSISWLGDYIEFDVMQTPDQFLPRQLLVNVIKQFPKFSADIVGLNVRMQEVDELLRKLIEVSLERKEMKNPKILTSLIDNIVETIKDYKNPMNVELSLMVLGNEIAVWNYNQEDISTFLEDVVEEMLQREHQIFKVVPIYDRRSEFVTLNGFPIECSSTADIIIQHKCSHDIRSSDIKAERHSRLRNRFQSKIKINLPNIESAIVNEIDVNFELPVTFEAKYGQEPKEFSLRFENKKDLEIFTIRSKPIVCYKEKLRSGVADEVILIHLDKELRPKRRFEPTKVSKYIGEEVFGGEVLRLNEVKLTTEEEFLTSLKREFSLILKKLEKPVELKATYSKSEDKKVTVKFSLLSKVDTTYTITTQRDQRNHLKFHTKWETSRPEEQSICIDVDIPPYERKFLRAGESNPFEILIKSTWGAKKCQNEKFIAKVVLDKSEKQKKSEREEVNVKDTFCSKCEKNEELLNVFCEYCRERRDIKTVIKTTIMVQKNSIPKYIYRMYKAMETTLARLSTAVEKDVPKITSAKLISDNKDIALPKGVEMSPYEITAVLNRHWSIMDLIVLNPEVKEFLRIRGIATLPYCMRPIAAGKRFDEKNLKNRIIRPGYGKCLIDHKNNMITLDGILFTLPREDYCVSEELVKCKNGDMVIKSIPSKNGRERDIVITLPRKTIEVVAEENGKEYTYKILKNSKPLNEEVYRDLDISIRVIRPTTPDQRNPVRVLIRLHGHGVTIVHRGSLVSIEVPHLYRSQLEGLCGNFNGEVFDKLEFGKPEITSEHFEKEAAKRFTVKSTECRS